jgi:hypothetical protein
MDSELKKPPAMGRGTEWTATTGIVPGVDFKETSDDDCAMLQELWRARLLSSMLDRDNSWAEYKEKGAGWSLKAIPMTVRLKFTWARAAHVYSADLKAVRACLPDFVEPSYSDSFSSIGSGFGESRFKFGSPTKSVEAGVDRVIFPEDITGGVRRSDGLK